MERYLQLSQMLTALTEDGKLCVAFSGGVDSALLVTIACDIGIKVYAVTFDSNLQPIKDAELAAKQAAAYGAEHSILQVDVLANEKIGYNSRERCYYCKYSLFKALSEYAVTYGINTVIDGTNADDLMQYRPGLQALQELSIISPLAKLGITKTEVREIAAEIGLDVAKRPSSPCLATRFPYGTKLLLEELRRCDQAEMILHSLGFNNVRVRVHENLARIEVSMSELSHAVKIAGKIDIALRKIGYSYVTLDLAGYHSGCYDVVNERK